jgi:hypothetical protein
MKTVSEQADRLGASPRSPRTDWRALLLALSLVCSLSCIEGGDFADNGGMSGTGISQGSVTAFGSIFVNGVEWQTNRSQIEIEGVPSVEADLRLGMVVRVEGTRSADGQSGRATRVVVDDSIEGPVVDIRDTAPGLRQLEILGVTVSIELDFTRFDDGASFAGLADDDVVEVSGFADTQGGIRATRVALKGMYPGQSEVELKGVVSNLDRTANRFSLGTVLVQYDDATTEFEDLANESELSDGLFVEVKGELVQPDRIDAARIEREEEGLGDADSDAVELEGVVTSVTSQLDFQIGGVRVDASSTILDPPGLVIAAGLHVEVEGRLSAGVLIAEKVENEEAEDEDQVRIHGAVTSIDHASRTLVILDVTVRADGDTEIEDESAANVSNFRFEDIAAGNWLEIRGSEEATGAVLARDIERDDATLDVIFQGPVTQVQTSPQNALWILDRPVPIIPATVYSESNGMPLLEAEFFDAITGVMPGDVVRAVDANALDSRVLGQADEVSFE